MITGAAGGIGQALCGAFSREDCRIVATDFRQPCHLPPESHFVEVDLDTYCSDWHYRGDANERLVAAIGDGRLDTLVNNAALQVVKPAASLTAEDWTKTLNVNLVAPFLLTQAFLDRLTMWRGTVINISSVHSALTKPGFAAYATSKAALNGLTRSLAVEFGGRVRFNAICPAAVATTMLVEGFSGNAEALASLAAMHPMGRIGEPEEVAQLALFLSSGQCRFITGAEIALDGGIRARLHDPA